MAEKKFGETPLFGQNLFEAIVEEKKKEGFEYAGVESLTAIKMGDDNIFSEVPTQTLEQVEAKYKKLEDGREVKLLTDPRDTSSVWVFLKTK
jgi:hypothetical protein